MPISFPAVLHHRENELQSVVLARPEPGVLLVQREGETSHWLPGDIQSVRLLDDGSTILQNGLQYLEVPDPRFAPALQVAFGNKHLFSQPFFDKAGTKGCLLVFLILLLPLLAAWFWLVPFIADRAAQQPELETQIGEKWHHSLAGARTVLTRQFFDSLDFAVDFPRTHQPDAGNRKAHRCVQPCASNRAGILATDWEKLLIASKAPGSHQR